MSQEDNSRHKLQKGFVRRIGHASISTKETKIRCTIALPKSKNATENKPLGNSETKYASISTKPTKIPSRVTMLKSKETNKNKILEDNTTIELNKQPNANNNNVLDHITKTSIDNQKVLSPNISINSLSFKKRNTFNIKNNNKIIETVYSDTDSSVPSENIISSGFPKKSLLNNKDVTKVKKSDIVTVPESISRDCYGDSCAPINISQSKQIIKDKPLNEIIIDNNIVENIINKSLSRDADSDTFTTPYNVNIRRKRGRKKVTKPINEMVTNCDIKDNIIIDAESTFVNSDNAKVTNTNLRSKTKNKTNTLNELIVDVIPESLSRRADSDLVKEHVFYVDDDYSVNEIINKDAEENKEHNSNEGSGRQTIDGILNYLNPMDNSLKEASKPTKSESLLDIAIESPVIDNTAVINKSVPTTVKSKNKKKKKKEKEKLTRTIEKTKPPIQKQTSTRILQAKKKTIPKRKLYSANKEVVEDQNNVNICVNKPFRSEGGSCYKDILRDRKKHIARKSIKCKACSPPLSPRSIKRNKLFDQLRTSDQGTNNSKLNNRDIALYNFTTDEDDDDINARCNIYEIKYKSPEEPKDHKKKQQKKGNKTISLKAKKKTKNIDENTVVVNMTDFEDLVKLQDERMRDAPKEDHLNTSIVMITDEDSSDNIVLSRLISKHHMKPVVEIMEVENELLKTKTNKKSLKTVKENKAEDISAIEEIKVKKNDKKRKQQTKADNKVKSENIKYTKKEVVRNNKVKNKSQESIQSLSPLPELIIEKKGNKVSEKSDDDSIERLKLIKNSSDIQEDIEFNNVTLNDTIESDKNALKMTCEIVEEEEKDTNKERDKEIMPSLSCSPIKAKKRYLSRSLDSVEISKRRRKKRLSDFCQEHARVNGEEQIKLDKLQGGPGNRDVKEELNISLTNDVAEAPEPWMDEEFINIRQSFQSFIEEIDDKFCTYKQTIEDRFKKFVNEFQQSSKNICLRNRNK